MNDVKLQAKNKRIEILKAIDTIEATVCSACPVSKLTTYEKQGKHLCNGCEHFSKINALGEDLVAVTNASRSVPEVLNRTSYQLLKDRDWTDKEIQKHFDLSFNDFDFFLSQNQLHSRKSHKGFTKKIDFDVNAYTEWVMQGKKDYAFCEYYGISRSALKVHKTKFGIKTSAIPKPPKPPKPKRIRKKPIQTKSEVLPMGKITVDVYESHRERKMRDKDIAKLHNMTMSNLSYFKTKNGLSNKRKLVEVVPTEEVKAVELEGEKAIEQLVNVIEGAPKEMPTIMVDWEPSSIVAELSEGILHDTAAMEQQFEIEKLKSKAELWESRQKDTERKFFDLSGEHRQLDVDYQNLKTYCETILKENSELKETVTLNHLLMKQQVRFLDRLDDLVANPTEASEFVWR